MQDILTRDRADASDVYSHSSDAVHLSIRSHSGGSTERRWNTNVLTQRSVSGGVMFERSSPEILEVRSSSWASSESRRPSERSTARLSSRSSEAVRRGLPERRSSDIFTVRSIKVATGGLQPQVVAMPFNRPAMLQMAPALRRPNRQPLVVVKYYPAMHLFVTGAVGLTFYFQGFGRDYHALIGVGLSMVLTSINSLLVQAINLLPVNDVRREFWQPKIMWFLHVLNFSTACSLYGMGLQQQKGSLTGTALNMTVAATVVMLEWTASLASRNVARISNEMLAAAAALDKENPRTIARRAYEQMMQNPAFAQALQELDRARALADDTGLNGSVTSSESSRVVTLTAKTPMILKAITPFILLLQMCTALSMVVVGEVDKTPPFAGSGLVMAAFFVGTLLIFALNTIEESDPRYDFWRRRIGAFLPTFGVITGATLYMVGCVDNKQALVGTGMLLTSQSCSAVVQYGIGLAIERA